MKRLGFTTNNHNRTIYRAVYNPTVENIFLLIQVEDFVLSCSNKSATRYIYNQIGVNIKIPGESDKSFAYLGLVVDSNKIDI